MSASTTQDISEIEARLTCIETVLVRVHAVLGNIHKAGNIRGWESQIEELYGLSGDACVAAFSLHAVDLEVTSCETDIAIRRRQAMRRAEMQEAIKMPAR